MRPKWRKGRGTVFGALSVGALMVGLLALATMIAATVLQARRLTAMDATSQAGLALSLRSVEVPGREFVPYVVAAQVDPDSAAERAGLSRGDVLVGVGGSAVSRPDEVWDALGKLGPGSSTVSWIPKPEKLWGPLRAVVHPERPGELGVTLAAVPVGSPAERAGLRPGDALISVAGLPVTGTRQAWELVVGAVRQGPQVLTLVIERGRERQELAFDPIVQGEIPFQPELWRAWGRFLTRIGDPRYPERAGLLSALVGSLLVVGVMALFAFPLGVGAAVYLEEYASQNWFTEVLQVLIANLAGMPSAVVGIFGLEIFARSWGLGRSVFAGGLTLALLVLPMTIVAAREALRTVPRWVREAAASVGATPWQVIRFHVLPYALPGIFTGIILALARALGEAAPLLLLGAFLYVTYVPQSLLDSFTIVPLQIFDWATKPQDGFAELAAAAILVLIAMHLVLNSIAIVLRNRYQRRWA